MKKLIVVIPYFGKPIKWLNFFLASCAKNSDVDWLIVSDFEILHRPKNVHHLFITFDSYRSYIATKLGIQPNWNQSYKLCDLKPALGFLHEDIVKNYDFWAFGDMDLVYGDILDKYESLMKDYDIISSHTYLLAGHLSIFKVMNETNLLFTVIPNWKEALSSSSHLSFDEVVMTEMLVSHLPKFNRMEIKFSPQLIFDKKVNNQQLRIIFKEQYTTFFTNNWLMPNGVLTKPTTWTWDHGRLFHDAMPGNILYGHFSFWNSARYGDTSHPDSGIWNKSPELIVSNIPYDDIQKFKVSKEGFLLI